MTNTSEGTSTPATTAGDTSDLLLALLARRDATCPLCGYSLKGLTTSKCPECGTELELHIRPTHPRMAAWTTGLVGLASGFGFYLIILGFFTWAAILDGHVGDLFTEVWPMWLGLWVYGGLVLVWTKLMRWLRRCTRRTRILLAVSCWGFTAGGSVALIWLLLVVVF